jgi:DNA repair exonuclease SbcCD ATPase subunit
LDEIENEFTDNEKQIEICNNELTKLKAKQDELIATQKNAISELQEIKRYREKEHGEILVKLRILETTNEGLVNNLKTLEANITKCEVTIVNIDTKENPYTTLEFKRQKDIKVLQQSIDELIKEYSVNKKDYDAYSYWVKGFKEIRLLLLYDSLKEFEISINNNLSKFGMEGWKIELDIDKENKSGTLRKGFTVLVQSPHNNGSVPFDCWSGGEGQRLRLAGTLGLMDLIQSKRQVDFGIEIFDESSAWLSDKGVSDLVQILFERAKDNNKTIFLIDHKGLGSYGSFTGEIKIIKDKKGSRIEIL